MLPRSRARALAHVIALLMLTLVAACASRQASASAEPRYATLAIPAEPAPDLRVRGIAPGIYLVTHSRPWPSNSLIVSMPDRSLLLVDTPYTPEATRALLRWVRSFWKGARIQAVN